MFATPSISPYGRSHRPERRHADDAAAMAIDTAVVGLRLRSGRFKVAARLTWLLYVVLFVLLAVAPAAAQNSSDGSLYSRFGIGELQSFSSAQGEALGHSGVALHSLNYLNISNPGTWADQVLTRASAGFTYQNLRIADAADVTSRLASGYLNGVQFGFPILQQRLGIAFGFVPYSRVSYSVVNQGVLDAPSGADTTGYQITFSGSGGLQQIVGGIGYRLNRNLSLGVSINGIFGIVENGRRTSFFGGGSTSGFTPTNLETSTRLNGLTATLGTYLNFRRLLRDEDFIGLGATFTLPTKLTGTRVRTLGESLDRDTLGTSLSGDVELPWGAALGLSYQPNASWTLSAGAEYAPWTEFSSNLPFPGYEPGRAENLKDRWQVGSGIEFLPAGSDLLAPYYERIGYRIGVSYDQSYITPSPSDRIRTLAGTAGLSLPTMLSGTRLDLNIQVGTRGKTEGILVRDVFYRFAVGVNIGERWFQTPRLQ